MRYTLDTLDVREEENQQEIYHLYIFCVVGSSSNYYFDTPEKLERFLTGRNFHELQPYAFISDDLKSLGRLERIWINIKPVLEGELVNEAP